jgi:DNA replication protein DnaC
MIPTTHFKYFYKLLEIPKDDPAPFDWVGCSEDVFNKHSDDNSFDTKKIEFGDCNRHGEFELKTSTIGHKNLTTTVCPKCGVDTYLSNPKSTDAQKELQSSNPEIKMKHVGITKRLMRKTFDDFIADTDKKRFVLDRVKGLVDTLLSKDVAPSMIFYGGVGTGKSLLASCVAKSIMHKRQVRIVKAIDLYQEIMATYRKDSDKSERQIIQTYGKLDLLVIEEIGIGKNSEFESNILFRVIDERYNELKPTILTSNLGIKEFQEWVDSRVMDRMREDGGKMISFDWESCR